MTDTPTIPDGPPPPEDKRAPAPELDRRALRAAGRKETHTGKVGAEKTPQWWEHPDVPPGTTKESLAVVENGQKIRPHGPTHYHHLADGRVIADYTSGTHYTEPGDDDEDIVTPIVAIYAG